MKQFLASACAVVFLGITPAWATGGFSCIIDDANLKFDTQSAMGRGMGSPFLNLEANGEIKLKGVAADLATLELSKHLVHSWMAHPDTRLLFYREREANKPHGFVELIISTTARNDEGESTGTYELTVFDTEPSDSGDRLTATGKVGCFVE